MPAPPEARVPGAVNARGRKSFVAYVLGTVLLATSAAALLFALYALLLGEPPAGYLVSVAVALPLGALLRARGSAEPEPSRREALAGVLLTWLALPAVSAVPYALAGHLTPVEALFEAMSGFTTTGVTTMLEPAAFGRSLLLWRAFSQWVGGIGIVVLFVAVFPQLAIGGRQLFFAEVPGPEDERLAPRLRSTAVLVLSLYAALTLVAVAAFYLTGMSLFDAVAYAFASVAAGGFAPDGVGLAGRGVGAQAVALVFMFLAGVSFPLLYRAFTGRPGRLFRNAEFRAYVGIMVVAGALLAATSAEGGVLRALWHGLFMAVSFMTSTGAASTEYAAWGAPALTLLGLLLFVGGSAGSASGGVKVVRWLIVFKHAAREVRRALHPRAVLPVRLGERVIPEEVVRSVVAFLLLYMALFVLGALALVFLGEDPLTALVTSAACLGNTGAGPIAGFGGSAAALGPLAGSHPASLGVLTFLMYAGRLEVVTVLVLLNRSFWRLPVRR